MSATTFHCCLSVRGALRRPSMLRGCLTNPETGRTLTMDEVQGWLMDELAAGHEVVPLTTPACEGFDYSGGGCPGHKVDEVVA